MNSANHSVLIVLSSSGEADKLGTVLNIMGCRTEIMTDGLEALDAYFSRRHDLILFEQDLAGMDGLDLALRIAGDKRGRNTPLVMLVDRDFLDSDLEGVHVDALLRRPISQRELRAEIDHLLKRVKKPEPHEPQPEEPEPEEQDDLDEFEDSEPVRLHIVPKASDAERPQRLKPDTPPKPEPPPKPKPEPKPKQIWPPPFPTQARHHDRPTIFENTGSLKDVSIPWLFADLHLSSYTGCLILKRPELTKSIHWLDGSLVHIETVGRPENLKQLLLREQLITKREAEAGIWEIPDLRLMQCLRLQNWENAVTLFGWLEGDYILEKADVNPDIYRPFALDTPLLIRRGLRRWYLPFMLKTMFQLAKVARFTLDPESPIDPRALNLHKDEMTFLKMFNREHNVYKIIFTSPLDLAQSLQTMYWLIALEVLVPADEQSHRELDKLGRSVPKAAFQYDSEEINTLVKDLADELDDFLQEID